MTPVRYVECPQEFGEGEENRSIFLAGGITGCPDWQADVRRMLGGSNWTLLNPRRAAPAAWSEETSAAQIEWEFRHLRMADAVLFWFPAESVCPIALFELGAWTMTDKPIFVGADPAYPRRRDIVLQTALARPEIVIHSNLEELIESVENYRNNR